MTDPTPPTDREVRIVIEGEVHRLGSLEGLAHQLDLRAVELRAVLRGDPPSPVLRRALGLR